VRAAVNRRDFFHHASLLSLGAATGAGLTGAPAAAVAQTPIPRVGGPKLKTSLNAYSFNKALNDNIKGRGKGVTLFDLLDYCAEQNFDGIDPTGYFFPGYPKVPTDKYVNDFKRRAFQLGLDVSGTGVRNDFATPDKEKRAADVKHVKEWVEVAARLGAPVLRVFAGPMPTKPGPNGQPYPWDEIAKWMVDDLKQCVEHAQRYGVLIGIQNHWDYLKTSEQVLTIVKMVDSEWFGTIVDTGYFLTADPYKDIAAVTPYAVNWQVKEKVDGQEMKVKTDLKRIVRIAREGGYRGYLPIETLSKKTGEEGYDPRARVAALLKELREAMQQPTVA
jgi:sugar phosphate isomerase/epimerase